MSETNGKQRQTLVEEGTEFKGTMTSKCPVTVMGKVDGDISAPSMHIAESGSVAGVVKVQALRSEGELAGEVEAESVQLSGRVKDGTIIRANSLEVKLARPRGKMELVFGECEIEVGDAPDKATAVEAARSGGQQPAAPEPEAAIAAEAGVATEPVAEPVDDGKRKRNRSNRPSQPPPV
jgi:cytoskeletal protein CcmA (bactofilin family)